jgi:hypothetical protein
VVRRTLVALAVLVVAGTLVGAAGAKGGASALEVLKLQDSLIRSGKFTQLYQLFTPRFQASCPYATFAAQATKNKQAIAPTTLKVLGSRVAGTKAYLSYEYLQGSKVLGTVKDDLYVQIGGRWFDEVDKNTHC